MKQFILLSLSIWIWTSSCNDPVLVGSGLLEEEALEVGLVDNMLVSARTIRGERSITFRNFDSGYSANTYMVGTIEDAVFGKSDAVTYFTPDLLTSYPEFTADNLDSVIISIPLDTAGFYGDINAVHDLELRVLTEYPDLAVDDTLFSDRVLETETMVVSSRSLILHPTDSLQIKGYITDDPDSIVNIGAELRMPLDKQFWIDINAPGDTLLNDDLRETVPGFELRSTPSASSMFGLDLLYAGGDTTATINFYYNPNDDSKAIYTMALGRIRHSTFTTDYSGSDLGSAIDMDDTPLLYIQSQAGTDIAVDISDIRNYNDRILNSATMELTVVPEDETLYRPAEAIFAFARNDEGELFAVGAPTDTSDPLKETFSGGERRLNYSINLTNHLNQVKKGNITTDSIFLIATSKAERPNRSIILGPDDQENPLHIDLILTKP